MVKFMVYFSFVSSYLAIHIVVEYKLKYQNTQFSNGAELLLRYCVFVLLFILRKMLCVTAGEKPCDFPDGNGFLE